MGFRSSTRVHASLNDTKLFFRFIRSAIGGQYEPRVRLIDIARNTQAAGKG